MGELGPIPTPSQQQVAENPSAAGVNDELDAGETTMLQTCLQSAAWSDIQLSA